MRAVTVFAYGTLLTGARSRAVQGLLDQHLVRAREGFVRGRLYDLGPYPGLVPAARRSERVYGQVLELQAPQRGLALLDDYEDYDPQRPNASTYIRHRSRIGLVAGGTVQAWVYWYQGRLNDARRISDGDWRGWVERPARA